MVKIILLRRHDHECHVDFQDQVAVSTDDQYQQLQPQIKSTFSS